MNENQQETKQYKTMQVKERKTKRVTNHYIALSGILSVTMR